MLEDNIPFPEEPAEVEELEREWELGLISGYQYEARMRHVRQRPREIVKHNPHPIPEKLTLGAIMDSVPPEFQFYIRCRKEGVGPSGIDLAAVEQKLGIKRGFHDPDTNYVELDVNIYGKLPYPSDAPYCLIYKPEGKNPPYGNYINKF